jgi:hypothetical protein
MYHRTVANRLQIDLTSPTEVPSGTGTPNEAVMDH